MAGVGGGSSGPGPKCPRCGNTVYDAERAIGINTVSSASIHSATPVIDSYTCDRQLYL